MIELAKNYSTVEVLCYILTKEILKNQASEIELLYILSNQKQPSCKKRCGPQKGHGEKRCEIQGGGQEMAVMVG